MSKLPIDEDNSRMMNPLTKCLLGCGMDCSRFNWIVVGVLFVHAYIYGTVVTCVIIPWFENSVPGVMNLAFLTANTGMSLICYILCVVTDAGRVPEDWKPDEDGNQLVTQVKKKGGGARFCQKCNLPKPARCHHCRVCKRCVLRMDHHCPWVNNCIGHRNYKAFFLLLIYITAAALHALGLLALYALNNIQQAAKKNRAARLAGQLRLTQRGLRLGASASGTFGIAQAVCFCITLPITVGLLMLLGWHVYLILCNKTTIEYHEGVTAKVQARKSGQRYQHPYHIGPCGNLHAVLGANILGWLWPLPAGADGPGTTYPVGIDPF